MGMGFGRFQELVMDREAWHAVIHGVAKSQTQWTELNWGINIHYLHHSLASGQTTGREHSPACQQKIGLRFSEHGPAHQNKTQFPPQSISPIRKLP